jgi:hypothetical protein
MFWIALLLFSSLTLRGQDSREYLPPLPTAANSHNSISSSEFQFLVPAAQLICWSHGAGENPQNSHNNDSYDVLPAHVVGNADPLLVPTATAVHEERKGYSRSIDAFPRRDVNRSVRWTEVAGRPGVGHNQKRQKD